MLTNGKRFLKSATSSTWHHSTTLPDSPTFLKKKNDAGVTMSPHLKSG